MTAPAQFTILREQILPSSPRPGEVRTLVAITYQLAARPPQVILIPEADLPDRVFLKDHPQETEAPPELVEAGQELRRQHIQSQNNRTPRAAV